MSVHQHKKKAPKKVRCQVLTVSVQYLAYPGSGCRGVGDRLAIMSGNEDIDVCADGLRGGDGI